MKQIKPSEFAVLAKPIPDDKQRQSKYKELFLRTPLGKEVLEDILYQAGLHRSAYSKDSGQRDYNLGRQHVGYDILNLMKADMRKTASHE